MASFDFSGPKLLRKEGGYVFNKNDPGGETKYGISKKSYPHLDIKNITKEEAWNIYRRDFWDPLHLDSINNQAVADQILDTAANMGIKTGAIIAQRAAKSLGKNIAVDGTLGPATIAAINSLPSSKLASQMVRHRIDAYNAIVAKRPESREFLKGWLARAKSFGSPAAGLATFLAMLAGGYLLYKRSQA